MDLEPYHHASSSSIMTRHNQRHRLAGSPCRSESLPVEHVGHASFHHIELSGSFFGWCRSTATARASTKTTRWFGCWWVLLPLVTAVLSLARILDQNGNYCAFCRSVVPTSLANKKYNMQDQLQLHSSCDCFLRSGQPSPIRGHNDPLNDDDDDDCCEHVIWRTHKFGTVLLGDLFADFRRRANRNDNIYNATTVFRIKTRPSPQSINYTLPMERDYRHVLVTRNWREAMVSGYLYHRAGYECTIDFRGTTSHHSKHFDMERHYHHKLWDTPKYLTYHYQQNMSFPPRHNRSLCTYLAQESESVGMAIVMDLALSRWYKGIVKYHQMASASAPNKTLFLCFEDLVDPFQQEPIYYQILNFLFPTNDDNNETKIDWTNTAPMPGAMKQALVRQQQQQSAPSPNLNQSQQQPSSSSSSSSNNSNYYEGGHASSHDPQLRARLRSLVEYWDQSLLFQGAVTESNAIFQCGR